MARARRVAAHKKKAAGEELTKEEEAWLAEGAADAQEANEEDAVRRSGNDSNPNTKPKPKLKPKPKPNPNPNPNP